MKTLAPPAGALVEYGRNGMDTGPGLYRVKSWMRVAPPRAPVDPSAPGTTFDDVMEEILFEASIEIAGNRMQWCLRSEATHLALSGVCGRIAPIAACRVTGMVEWSPKELRQAELDAERRGQAHEILF